MIDGNMHSIAPHANCRNIEIPCLLTLLLADTDQRMAFSR